MKELNMTNLKASQEAAAQATQKYINEVGEHPFNCGFAWVVVKGVRGNKAKLLREFGFDSHYAGGLSLWNPSNNYTQDMSAKAAGATVFAAALREMGINASADSRLD